MNWWLLITAGIAAALAYGYWTHTRERRHLARLFALVASDRHGEVKPGNWLVFPQLRFETTNRRYLVTAMATAGTDTADSGPFTSVDLRLPSDTRSKLRIRRTRGNTRRLPTSHQEFDEVFQVDGSNLAFASSLLEASVRQRLLSSRLPRLDIRLEGRQIIVHMDGIAPSKADIEELIDIAGLIADQSQASQI